MSIAKPDSVEAVASIAAAAHLLPHQEGMAAALSIGVDNLREATTAIAPHRSRMRELCRANGIEFDHYLYWLLLHLVNWRACAGALDTTITAHPGARVISIFGSAWLPPRHRHEQLTTYAMRLDPVLAVTQACSNAIELGSEPHVITTGGVVTTEVIAGEVDARRLMKLVSAVMGTNGMNRIYTHMDMASRNTGDQANILGALIATILLQNPHLPVILANALPAVHAARFTATLLAGIARLLPTLLQGRPAHLQTPNNEPIIVGNEVDLARLSTRLIVCPYTAYSIETYQPQTGLTAAEEAFKPRQSPKDAALVRKPLGDELIKRLLDEMGPPGQGYTCPAMRPEHALHFIAPAYLRDFETMRGALTPA